MAGALKREKMVLWLRGLLLRHWRLNSDSAPPAAFGLVAAHSLKCTLLAWGRQPGSESELRRIQGPHGASGSDKSVSLYPRDDIVPMLRFQRQAAHRGGVSVLRLPPSATHGPGPWHPEASLKRPRLRHRLRPQDAVMKSSSHTEDEDLVSRPSESKSDAETEEES